MDWDIPKIEFKYNFAWIIKEKIINVQWEFFLW